jgi:hypothetical protein
MDFRLELFGEGNVNRVLLSWHEPEQKSEQEHLFLQVDEDYRFRLSLLGAMIGYAGESGPRHWVAAFDPNYMPYSCPL